MRIEERIATLQAYYNEMAKSVDCLLGLKKDVAVLQNDMENMHERCDKYDKNCDECIRYQERQKNMEKRVEALVRRINKLDKMLKSFPDMASSYKSAKSVVVSNLVKWGLAGLLMVIATVTVNVGWKIATGGG